MWLGQGNVVTRTPPLVESDLVVHLYSFVYIHWAHTENWQTKWQAKQIPEKLDKILRKRGYFVKQYYKFLQKNASQPDSIFFK